MNRRKIMIVLFVCWVLSFAAGCSDVAITGRKQFNVVPDAYINKLSFQNYQEFISQSTLSNDAAGTAMVKDVGSRIQAAVIQYCKENDLYDRIADYQWEFNLVEDKAVNAWAMPGGKIVVYTGLLEVAQGENGLATVMGHEIAHVIARHGGEQMSQSLLIELGGMALSEAMKSKPEQTQQLFEMSYRAGSTYGVMLPYSRTHELEADHMGLIFMAMAGYDPATAVDFWTRMSAQSGGGDKLSELLSTHPVGSTRIAKINELLPEANTYYQNSAFK